MVPAAAPATWTLEGMHQAGNSDQSLKESASNARDPGSILGGEDPLEERMATHSSILAWRIPWTEESHGLQSTRVGHNLATKPSRLLL